MGDSFLLGRATESGFPLCYPSDGHPVVLGAPGTGKSRCFAMPNLARLDGSIITKDKGGELTKGFAHWRRQKGHQVFVNDPLRVVDPKYIPRDENGNLCYGRISPIDFIRKSKSPQAAAFRIAEAAIPPGGHQDSHWHIAGQLRLTASLLFVATDPLLDEPVVREYGWKRDMATAWRILSNPVDEKLSLQLMCESENSLIADQGATFYKSSKQNTELQNIRNQIRVNCTKTFSDPAIMETMQGTNIPLSEIGKRPIDIFMVMPGDVEQTHRAYTRINISMMLSEIEASGLREYGAKQRPTTFMLDEFASLGNFPLITDAMARLRGFGAMFNLYIQTIGQLKETYGEGWNTIMGLVDPVVYFGGSNDPFQNKQLSELFGTGTEVKTGTSEPFSSGKGGSANYSYHGRLLYTPDEVGRLAMPKQIIKMRGHNPVEAILFRPDLSEFPDVVAFQLAIEKGFSPEEASAFCEQYRLGPYVPPPAPYRPPQPPPAAKKRASFMARLMGQDDSF